MVITIKTDDNKTYETSSLISGFALGGLLELGIKDKKEDKKQKRKEFDAEMRKYCNPPDNIKIK